MDPKPFPTDKKVSRHLFSSQFCEIRLFSNCTETPPFASVNIFWDIREILPRLIEMHQQSHMEMLEIEAQRKFSKHRCDRVKQKNKNKSKKEGRAAKLLTLRLAAHHGRDSLRQAFAARVPHILERETMARATVIIKVSVCDPASAHDALSLRGLMHHFPAFLRKQLRPAASALPIVWL